MSQSIEVSIKGRPVRLPSIGVLGIEIVQRGRAVTVGEIFDEYWLERDRLPAAPVLICALQSHPDRPDLFTFCQRVPDNAVHFPAYRHDTTNYAVLPLTTYDEWFNKQIPSATRRNIRASEKRGIAVRASEYDDAYVRGISGIFNETPVRAGRRYWHYGKDLETVRNENGTYASRSTFLAAYHGEEMVGYLKVVWDRESGAIMQILSKITARDQRVNNALMAEAVRQACSRGIRYLIYEHFDYGKKTGDSLTRFKQSNGFARMDIPRYFVPLTWKGALALKLGLHRGLKELVPEWAASRIRNWRSQWHERHQTAEAEQA